MGEVTFFSPAEILALFSGCDTLSLSSLPVSSCSSGSSRRFLEASKPEMTFSPWYPFVCAKTEGTHWPPSHSFTFRAPSFSPPWLVLLAPCPRDKVSFKLPHLWRTGTRLFVNTPRRPGQRRRKRMDAQKGNANQTENEHGGVGGVKRGKGLTDGELQLNTSQLLFCFKGRQ